MNVRSLERKTGFRRGTGAILSVAAVLALCAAPRGFGHEHTAPWLDESSLDRGLYVEVRHPRVIRNPRSFDVSILLNNLLGGDAVTVREVRYSLPGAFDQLAHPRRQALSSKRVAYRRYKAILEEMQRAGVRSDRASVARLRNESRLRLLDIAAGAFRDRQPVDAAFIPEVGRVMNLTVEVDLVENGRPRTIRRDVAIPVQPLLPDGDGSWFAGDQHLHTAYSIDAFFLFGTLENVAQFAATAQTIGLDWIIISDHTNLNFLVWYQPFLFTWGEALAMNYRNQNDYLVLQGQEMGIGSPGPLGEPAHLLAYPFAADSTGFLPNPCPGFITGHLNCEPEQVILDRVNDNGGIGFIAHPFDSGFLFYAPWDQNSGAVGWAGLEIFSSDTGFFKNSDSHALAWWHELLDEIPPPQGGGLADRPDYPTRFPVGLGNSDAHHTTRIGNVFSYARLPGVMHGAGMVPRPDLMSAFVEGRVVASNGPLAYGEIQGAGTGGVAVVFPGENQITLTLETTPEFGPVSDYLIKVFVDGVERQVVPPNGATGFSRTVVVDEVFSPPDKFVTIVAQRFQCEGCPHEELRYLSVANPIWLELSTPIAVFQPKRAQ
jgi:hypothetical protein